MTSQSEYISYTPVETQSHETLSYYPAYVIDVDSNSNIFIGYENNWRPAEWVAPDDVRFSPASFDPAAFSPQRGELVEVLAKSSDEEPYSWWGATIKNVKGEFYMIAYQSWEDDFNEILEKDMLRPYNLSPSLATLGLTVSYVPIPQDLWSIFTVEHLHTVRQSSQSVTLLIDSQEHRIRIVANAACAKRAAALLAMAFKHLSEISRLKARRLREDKNGYASTSISPSQSLSPSQTSSTFHTSSPNTFSVTRKRWEEGHVEEFQCSPALMGLVIGKKGHNVRQAEKVDGILHIKVDNSSATITILASTQSAALKARALLEFTEERIYVPKSLLGRVVGKGFAHLRDIEERAGVSRIRVESEGEERDEPRPEDRIRDKERYEYDAHHIHPSQSNRNQNLQHQNNGQDDSLVTLLLIGTHQSVSDAKAMIELHLSYLLELQSLSEEEKKRADRIARLNREISQFNHHTHS
jgi:hypothetical protein